jgi:hypothetical protein
MFMMGGSQRSIYPPTARAISPKHERIEGFTERSKLGFCNPQQKKSIVCIISMRGFQNK